MHGSRLAHDLGQTLLHAWRWPSAEYENVSKLGTGVAVASSRIAPVTVHSIATINQLAPGRVILGFGTGHTGRRVMGLPPVKQADFREQARLIHDLLRDGEGLYHTEGVSRKSDSCIAIADSSISMTRFHFTLRRTVPSRLRSRVSTGTACLRPASSSRSDGGGAQKY